MTEQRQFEEMAAAARETLLRRSPEEIARCCGFDWNGTEFRTESFGRPLRITWPACTLCPPQEMWHTLLILQYMAFADGGPLTGNDISLCEFRAGGTVRGTSFDRANDRRIAELGRCGPERICAAAAALGGERLDGKADLSFRFHLLPRYPLVLNLWLADEEFPASGKVLSDAGTQSSLSVEGAGFASELLLRRLSEGCAAQK